MNMRTFEAISLVKRTYVMGDIENMCHYTKQVDDTTIFIYIGKIDGILTKYLSQTIWNGYIEIWVSVDDGKIMYFSDEYELYVLESDEEDFYKY